MYCLSFIDNEVVLVLYTLDRKTFPSIIFLVQCLSKTESYTPAYWLRLGDKRIEAYFTAHSLEVSLDKNGS